MCMNDDEKIVQCLEKSRTRFDPQSRELPQTGGVYAIYSTRPTIGSFQAGNKNGLIYIGKSTDLSRRPLKDYFETGRTGFSTLRRSIEAILKQELGLIAFPRGPGQAESNIRNYKFRPQGEERLTNWMMENLEVAVYPVLDCYAQMEEKLIGELTPTLNLQG